MGRRHCLKNWTLVVLASVVAAWACSSSEEPTASFVAADAGPQGAVLAEGAWGTTACSSCVRTQCAAEEARCRAEPTCARRLECMIACPSSPDVEPDAACVDACPPPNGTVAERAASDLEICRIQGAGVLCKECPARAVGRRHPLLNQKCESPTWDAGPDATPVQETCTRCVAERCCDSRDRCRANPGCSELQDCYSGCTDNACIDTCYATYDSSVAAFGEKLACALLQCAVECGSSLNACAQCTTDKCADEHIACAADHDCWLLTQCISQCTDAGGCVDACNAKYPSGIDKHGAWIACTANRCPACK